MPQIEWKENRTSHKRIDRATLLKNTAGELDYSP